MKVLHLAPGSKYDLWVMCEDDDTCQVMEFLEGVSAEHPDLVEAIVVLFDVIPNEGPPLDDPRRAKMLYRNIIFELKADKDLPRREHLGLRVAFFFDGSVIVCTNAFFKSRGTPEEELEQALLERSRYYEGKDELEFVLEESAW
jgi:hypothetical protein